MLKKTVKYVLANRANYQASLFDNRTNRFNPEFAYAKSDYPDLKLTRKEEGFGVDWGLLSRRVLCTVNGQVFQAFNGGDGLVVKGATKIMLRSRQNQVGLLSFLDLGVDLNIIRFTEDMLYNESSRPLFERLTIAIPREVGVGFLVLAGCIIPLDASALFRNSPTSLVLRLDLLNHIDRLYLLQRYRNIFEELGIPVANNNPSLVDMAVVCSDAVVKKLLLLDNSFFVNVPLSNFNFRKIYLEHSDLPSTFRTLIEPTLPLMGAYGKLLEYSYRSTPEPRYIVNTVDAYLDNAILSANNPNEVKLYNDHRNLERTYRLHQAYFMEMYNLS